MPIILKYNRMIKITFPRPQGVGQSVTECVVKPLRDVKVTSSKPAGTKNPTMLRVGVAQAGCDPRVILMA